MTELLVRQTPAHGQVSTPTGPAGGDLAGEYPNPVIRSGAILDAHVGPTAAIAQSKILNLVTALSEKASDAAVVHLAGAETVTGVKRFTAGLVVGPASAASVPVVVAGVADQTSDHQQWRLPDGRAFAAVRNRQLITSAVNDNAHEIGRGTLVLNDLVANRSLELGFYEFGSGIFTSGGPGAPFEFFIHSGVLSLRNNISPPPVSHRLEVRVPDDAPGLNLESGRKKGNPNSPFGGHVYFDYPTQPMYVSSFDGTGFFLQDGGTVRFGGRMLPPDTNLSIALQAGGGARYAELGFGWWNGSFDATPWRLRLLPGGRKIGMTYVRAEVDVPRSTYWTDDGRVGVGTESPVARLDVRSREPSVPALIVRGGAGQSSNLQEWRITDGTLGMAIDRESRLRWSSALEQLTVGGAGQAAAPPPKPVKYLSVVDSTGAVVLLPAYSSI